MGFLLQVAVGVYRFIRSAIRTCWNSGPILVFRRRAFERVFATAPAANLFRGVFSSFAEAQASAPPTKPQGYDHSEPAKMYRDRTQRVYPADYPALFWLKELVEKHSPAPKVFDLGGHIGVAHYSFARYMNFPEGLDWLVCDVPAVARAGEDLAREKGAKHLRFTSRPEDCDGFDVLFTAGTLQYLEKPLAETLAGLSRPPRHLVINKVPLHPERSCVTLQSIGTAFCPYHVFQHNEFVRSFEAQGYRLVDSWENMELSCEIKFEPSHSVSHYSGMYLRRD